MQPTLWFSILAGYGLGIAAAALVLPAALAALALPVGIAAAMLVAAAVVAATAERARSTGRRSAVVRPGAVRAKPPVPAAADGTDAGPAAGLSAADVRRALDDGRVEVFVQPIVSLPQRRAAFYEGFARIRDESGGLVPPDRYLPAAEGSGLSGRIDLTLLFGCARVARRDLGADQQSRVFCNVSPRSLEDPRFVSDVTGFLAGKPRFAERLVLELGQGAPDAALWEALGGLRRLGVGFCLDRPAAGALDPAELARRGIGFVKIGARRFEAAAGLRQLDPELIGLHAALEAAGITPIVDGIESERALTEVLDYPVRYGQGRLFGSPEPLAAGPAPPPPGIGSAAERVYAWGLTWQKDAPALGAPAASPPG